MAPMRRRVAVLASLALLAGCASATPGTNGASAPSGSAAAAAHPVNQLLRSGRTVFGYFPRNPDAAQAASLAGNREIDFIMLSQEETLDLPPIQAYVQAHRDAASRAGVAPTPIFLRMPPVTDPASTRQRVEQVLGTGVTGIVFPHMNRAQQAETSADIMRGRDVGYFMIVEEPEGVGNVRDIVDTPGLSVVFAGPGTLAQTYKRDMVAVENAIQTILASCKQNNVACGITAGPNDIEERLRQGFRVIIVYDLAALPIGRRAAGRTD